MTKKGQGMSLNVVIIAALALIVLVVLTAIFISRMNTASEKSAQNDELAFSNVCVQPRPEYEQVKCADVQNCDSNEGWVRIPSAGGSGTGATDWMDCKSPKICCGLRG